LRFFSSDSQKRFATGYLSNKASTRQSFLASLVMVCRGLAKL
jgi:hypothetical protein